MQYMVYCIDLQTWITEQKKTVGDQNQFGIDLSHPNTPYVCRATEHRTYIVVLSIKKMWTKKIEVCNILWLKFCFSEDD